MPQPVTNPLFLREEELRRGIGLLLAVARHFFRAPPQALLRREMGWTHYQALFFIHQAHYDHKQGLAIHELKNKLKISRQSLYRILAKLEAEELVERRVGKNDRRERLFRLTETGKKTEGDITRQQSLSFAQAYRRAGAESVGGFHDVMARLLDLDFSEDNTYNRNPEDTGEQRGNG